MTPPLPHFVFYLSADWETYHRPDMIRAFARAIGREGAGLLCVDRLMCAATGPLRGAKTPLGGPTRGAAKWAGTLWRASTGRRRVEQLDDHLWLARAAVPLDDRFALRLGGPFPPLNRRLLRAQLRAALRAAGLTDRPAASWIQHPFWWHYIGLLDEPFSVYECFDNYMADPGLAPAGARRIEQAERRLLEKADLVITTSARLRDLKSPFHPRVHHVPNGADTAFYRRVRDEAVRPDPEIAALPRPIVGYLGTINEHTDLSLVLRAARARPGWSFVMMGKVDHRGVAESPDFRALQSQSNVRLLGWVERERILPVCKTYDACMIPYRADSEFNKFVNPNKLHEYTAMGKPIVAYGCVEVESHGALIALTQTPEDFIAAIERAIAEDGPERIAARLALAEGNSWDARVGQMLDHVRCLSPTRDV
jgi:glycosyltransferase involved in cell wall biosynthesis